MARFARVVVPGLPHHVTQRGNRREPIFFENGDHDVTCDMLAEQTRHGIEIDLEENDAEPDQSAS
jgi:putative transposase